MKTEIIHTLIDNFKLQIYCDVEGDLITEKKESNYVGTIIGIKKGIAFEYNDKIYSDPNQCLDEIMYNEEIYLDGALKIFNRLKKYPVLWLKIGL